MLGVRRSVLRLRVVVLQNWTIGGVMFEYFSNNYTWSLAVMSALNRGGQMSEIDEACRPLKEIAGIKALAGDPTQ